MIAAIYYDIYIRGGDGVLLNGAHQKGESPGNILSKTTSSGMTNDEYTGLPILICTYQELKQQGMRVGINSGGGLTPNNILNMLTKHFPLICQGESQI